jgi:hypothetical protein
MEELFAPLCLVYKGSRMDRGRQNIIEGDEATMGNNIVRATMTRQFSMTHIAPPYHHDSDDTLIILCRSTVHIAG